MSYILEALRKSDQQRQRGTAPTLLAVQTAAVAPRRPAFLLYGVLAAVLVGAGIVIGWLRPWESEQTDPGRAESAAAKTVESNPGKPTPAPSEMAQQPEAELQNAMRPAPSDMAPQSKAQAKLQDTRPAASEKAPKPQQKPERFARAKPQISGPAPAADAVKPGRAAPAPERPGDSAAADVVDLPKVISMAELPPSVRQELPAMKISVHAYSSNPGARLVGIDYRILHEGDDVVPGLKLEQITPDGMIFDYKGYRFSRGVK
jgi:general secretion pathway protein B